MRLRMVGATALALVLCAIAGVLGAWQLDAWRERRAAEARDLTRLEPVALTDTMGPDDPFPGDQVGRPVSLSGTWLPEGSFFVSDRRQDDVEGYWVVTPLETAPGEAVLVVRGWSTEPAADAAEGTADVVGWLQPPEGSTGVVDEDPTDDVLPQLRVADAIQRVEDDLYAAYVVADPARSTGVDALAAADLAERPEVGRFTALRNLLYAMEWWFFGLFAGFIWWRWVRDQRLVDVPGDEHPLVPPR